jgi:hypothetical protein
VKAWGSARVDWRSPAPLWIALAWVLGVAWLPLPLTLALWPSSDTGIETIRDPRAIAMVAGAISVTLTFYLINRERRRDGGPRTRLGVFLRFLAYGFVFTLLLTALADVGQAIRALFDEGDWFRRLGEAKATLVMGIVVMPLALVFGISYAVWAGLAACLVAFGPRRPTAKPRHYLMDELLPVEPAGQAAATATYMAPAPPPPLPPSGPHPETDIEAALRPDWD